MARNPDSRGVVDRPIRTVYVVLTHDDWGQAERLVRAIRSSSPEAHVIVAHDARTTRFPSEVDDARVEVFEHGLATDWGSWELVEATLLAFGRARDLVDPDLVCLVSGRDYPIRRLDEWEAEAVATGGWIGDARELRYTPHWGRRRGEGDDQLTRYTYRWFRSPAAMAGLRPGDGAANRLWRRIRGAVALRLEPVLGVRIVTRGRGLHYGIRRLRTPFSAERPCFGGSQWIALGRRELDRLLDEDLAPGSPLRRLYRHSVIPDESALVTALSWHAPPNGMPPVTQVTWDVEADRPTTRTLDDLDVLRASGSPFCRKVDPRRSATLMDALDRSIRATPTA
ncbi:hypothetical protein [Agromyces binzhouensis]|uniref:Core-2/I-Branching enzyme n=1 Tax=Agromyces binzhouensis TaxID=1817495 RepID=A0A4Q2JSF0_9MICO|nr:hypothetical protein [Agromyces binzhouensis]RXZ50144.1 hypothetical protein ESO86_03460 [Agromyces binzhouensis]